MNLSIDWLIDQSMDWLIWALLAIVLDAVFPRAALVEDLQTAEYTKRQDCGHRMSCFRERDRLSTYKQNLDRDNQKMEQTNENDGEAVSRMHRKVSFIAWSFFSLRIF